MKSLLAVLVLIVMVAALPGWAEPADTCRALPASGTVSGWDLRGEPRAFGPANLYEYIDGAADLFRAYGFTGLICGEYGQDSGEEHRITVDVYDMGAPIHAFGIFASERPDGATPLGIGNEGYSDAGLAAFWQGRYYVKVSQVAGDDAEAAAALAKATSANLPPAGGAPAELGRLPQEGRVAGSERYYRESALGHKFLVETVSARYRRGRTTAEVYVADLATSGKAAEGWKKLREFESSLGESVKDIPTLGESAFGARDSSLGELVAAKRGRYLVIATSTSASRSVITRFVEPVLARLGMKVSPAPLPQVSPAPTPETKPAPASGST